MSCDFSIGNYKHMKKTISKEDRIIIQKSFVPHSKDKDVYWTDGKIVASALYCFSEEPFQKKQHKDRVRSFSFINNPDGSIRWIFPSSSKRPGFLALYNVSSRKGRVLHLLIKLIFLFRLQSLIISGRFYLATSENILTENWKQNVDFDSFSVFTGTVGPNRKVLFALHKKDNTIGFVKHPVSYKSLCLVANEHSVLSALEGKGFLNMLVPNSKFLDDGDIFINNLNTKSAFSTCEFTNQHAKALGNLYQMESCKLAGKESSYYDSLLSMISGFEHDSHLPFHRELCNLVNELMMVMEFDKHVNFSLAHMDFTPWNMFTSKGDSSKLAVFDWELSRPQVPILYDLFHFIFQTGVLVERKSYQSILESVHDVIEKNEFVKEIIKKYQVDVSLHYRLYLLYNISYYINLYQKQEKLHVQVSWLAKVWLTALQSEVSIMSGKSLREVFIEDLFQFLDNREYAWLHSRGVKKEEIAFSSDLDLLLGESAQQDCLKFCNSHAFIKRVDVSRKSFMQTVEMFFTDGSFLSLDLITKLVRKNLVFMNAEEVLQGSIMNAEGIRLPKMEDDFNYILLFSTLNNSRVSSRYQHYYERIGFNKQTSLCQYAYEQYGIYAISMKQLFDEAFRYSAMIRKQIKSKRINSGFNYFNSTINYIVDTLKSFTFRKGFVVSFSGVDGVGKSTLIENVACYLKNNYRRKVVVLRHRPSLFPILSSFIYGQKEAEKRSVNNLPHHGNNRSLISSVVRFVYYYTDYLLGQFYVSVKYLLRGYVVLYDRYYFDFINDSRRSNISLSRKLVSWLYRFVHKPRYNFFFYASPEIIRARKQELSVSEIHQLTRNYLSTFESFSQKYAHSKYQSIENIDKEKTLQLVFNQLQHTL
jgi:thymidylate kinase